MSVLRIAGQSILPGETKILQLQVARSYDFSEISIPVKVIRGKEPGPTLFVSAAIHGDELNGVEIVRRLLGNKILRKIKGTLIAIPIVNVFGFNHQSRYLPDRRDLNRSFPGSPRGSLASRLAHLFMKEIVRKSTHGIDLHTGSIHRSNLPQIRADLEHPETEQLAHAFGVPVIINSTIRDGSLRDAARKRSIPMLLYEGGQALEFNETAIKSGLAGVLAVMKTIGMLPAKQGQWQIRKKTFVALSSYWVRAPQSGVSRSLKELGTRVAEGDVLGTISDPFGHHEVKIRAADAGIIVGKNNLPLVNQGDALFHIATFKDSQNVRKRIHEFRAELGAELLT